jgi:hypothetical protein
MRPAALRAQKNGPSVGDVRATSRPSAATVTLGCTELRAAQAPDQDTLDAPEGDREDLDAVLRYLLGEV